MKTKIQHILASATALSIIVIASSANANVEIQKVDTTIFTTHNVLVETLSFSTQETANQPVVKLAQKKISASRAKKIARSRVKGGEVVDISLRKSTYKVRVIAKNGRVVDVLIDANTGRVK